MQSPDLSPDACCMQDADAIWAQRACAHACTRRRVIGHSPSVEVIKKKSSGEESEMIRIAVLCVVLSWAVLVNSQRPTPCGKNRPVGHIVV